MDATIKKVPNEVLDQILGLSLNEVKIDYKRRMINDVEINPSNNRRNMNSYAIHLAIAFAHALGENNTMTRKLGQTCRRFRYNPYLPPLIPKRVVQLYIDCWKHQYELERVLVFAEIRYSETLSDFTPEHFAAELTLHGMLHRIGGAPTGKTIVAAFRIQRNFARAVGNTVGKQIGKMFRNGSIKKKNRKQPFGRYMCRLRKVAIPNLMTDLDRVKGDAKCARRGCVRRHVVCTYDNDNKDGCDREALRELIYQEYAESGGHP